MAEPTLKQLELKGRRLQQSLYQMQARAEPVPKNTIIASRFFGRPIFDFFEVLLLQSTALMKKDLRKGMSRFIMYI